MKSTQLGHKFIPLIFILGQLPRSADVIVEHDLVDKVKPGDRVQIVASYRALPGKQGGYTSGTFRTVLIANNIILRGGAEEGPMISGDDVSKCKKLAKQEKKRIFNILARQVIKKKYFSWIFIGF